MNKHQDTQVFFLQAKIDNLEAQVLELQEKNRRLQEQLNQAYVKADYVDGELCLRCQ